MMASGLAVGLSSLIAILAVPALMLPGLVWCMEAQRRLHKGRARAESSLHTRAAKNPPSGVM